MTSMYDIFPTLGRDGGTQLRSMKSAICFVTCLFCLWLAGAANGQLAAPESMRERELPTSQSREDEPREGSIAGTTTNTSSICRLIASAAAANGLPLEFFARVIWQESRFKADAIGPVTRSGQRAQGIAQFMPWTAEERLLHDPFDPVEALPKSGEFLRDMRAQFGNLGLAAAAYNAGPQRVRSWLAGKRSLPLETQAYVRIVTGHPVQEWARPVQDALMITIPREMSCVDAAMLAAKPQALPNIAQPKPVSTWVVQLVGDRSETKALNVYRQLRKKHEALLGMYEPAIVHTTLRAGGRAYLDKSPH